MAGSNGDHIRFVRIDYWQPLAGETGIRAEEKLQVGHLQPLPAPDEGSGKANRPARRSGSEQPGPGDVYGQLVEAQVAHELGGLQAPVFDADGWVVL